MYVVGKSPVRFLGRKDFRPIPTAILTPRGTVRTRKRPGRWGQEYQAGGPASWIRSGFVTVGLHCIAGRCGHYVKVNLIDLPQDQTWAQIGPRLLCDNCGEVGAVNIEPHWYSNAEHSKYTGRWGGQHPADLTRTGVTRRRNTDL